MDAILDRCVVALLAWPDAGGRRRVLARWHRRHVTRRALRSLSDAQLDDVGLDRATADAESRRPFWR